MEIAFECGGAQLFAREFGHPTSTPVVFIHGGLADHRAALRVIGLSETHRLIAPDLRAAGKSHFHGELSWERWADDIAALLDHLGIPKAIVGGTSMGAGVATAFALRHPNRLRGAIFLSPLYPGADRGLADAPTAAMKTMCEMGERVLKEGMDAIVPLYAKLPDDMRERATEMARSFDPKSVANTTKFLATNAQPFATAGDLKAITVKTVVVPGIDPQHPRDVADLYVANLPNAILLEQTPDLVSQIARAFTNA
ncbi:MAG: alpha/beta hydrolase [Kofleriaceae bacterium]